MGYENMGGGGLYDAMYGVFDIRFWLRSRFIGLHGWDGGNDVFPFLFSFYVYVFYHNFNYSPIITMRLCMYISQISN